MFFWLIGRHAQCILTIPDGISGSKNAPRQLSCLEPVTPGDDVGAADLADCFWLGDAGECLGHADLPCTNRPDNKSSQAYNHIYANHVL